ncbi:MAG: hypothetical protein ACHQJ5_00045 [Vicinamibacteria bacterium]|jgi:DNA-binding transcriptional regulator LsrR (DeoR family)
MSEAIITSDQIVGAAEALSQEEFTRGDVATQLGVEKAELKRGFVAARRSGRVEKVRDDAENTAHFRLIAQPTE